MHFVPLGRFCSMSDDPCTRRPPDGLRARLARRGGRWLTWPCLFSLVAFPPLEAQSPLRPGARVRLTAPSLGLVDHRGRVGDMRSDTIDVGSMAIPLASVTRLEVGRMRPKGMAVGAGIGLGVALAIGGEYSKTLLPFAIAGAAIGASPRYALKYGGVGALVGAAAGAAACADCTGSSDLSRTAYIVGAGAIGAGFGFSLGALIGSLTHLHHWEVVTPNTSTVCLTVPAGSVLAFQGCYRPSSATAGRTSTGSWFATSNTAG